MAINQDLTNCFSIRLIATASTYTVIENLFGMNEQEDSC